MPHEATLKLDLNEKLGFLLDPHRYKCLYGGRGSGKSTGIVDALLFLSLKKKLKILCARELQCSIRDSVHSLIKSRIDSLAELNPELPIREFFDVGQQSITTGLGGEFIFAGIRTNVSKVRSMEAIDIAFVEEAQNVSEESWSILIPTIRSAGSEIWLCFNPQNETDPTWKRFVKSPPPDCVSKPLNWDENPWMTKELEAEKDYLYATDPDAAAHVWGGGILTRTDSQVLAGKWVVEPFEPQDDWHGPYLGADWGHVHPNVLVKCWVSGEQESLEQELWIEHEAYGVGVDLDNIPELFDRVPGSRDYVIRADAARPETISHMQHHGYPRMKAAPKWQGSVDDGIAHLRSYKKIHIHERCKHAYEQAKLWSWKTDKLTGDVLPDLIKLNDDIWDAVRYALSPLIRRKKKLVFAWGS